MQETWIQVQGADNISFCGCVVGSWPAKLPTPQWRVLNRMGMDGDGEFVVRNFCTELSVSWNFCVLFCLFVCIGLMQPIFSTFIVVVVSTHEFIICTLIQKCYSVVLDFRVFEHKQLPCLCKRSHVKKANHVFQWGHQILLFKHFSNPPDIQTQKQSAFSASNWLQGTYLWDGLCQECIEGAVCEGSSASPEPFFLGKTDGEDVSNFKLILFRAKKTTWTGFGQPMEPSVSRLLV